MDDTTSVWGTFILCGTAARVLLSETLPLSGTCHCTVSLQWRPTAALRHNSCDLCRMFVPSQLHAAGTKAATMLQCSRPFLVGLDRNRDPGHNPIPLAYAAPADEIAGAGGIRAGLLLFPNPFPASASLSNWGIHARSCTHGQGECSRASLPSQRGWAVRPLESTRGRVSLLCTGSRHRRLSTKQLPRTACMAS
jgi:hypothetical protein